MIKPLHEREVNASSRAIVDKINEQSAYINAIETILRRPDLSLLERQETFIRLAEKYNV